MIDFSVKQNFQKNITFITAKNIDIPVYIIYISLNII